jgi:hypothetical protein
MLIVYNDNLVLFTSQRLYLNFIRKFKDRVYEQGATDFLGAHYFYARVPESLSKTLNHGDWYA